MILLQKYHRTYKSTVGTGSSEGERVKEKDGKSDKGHNIIIIIKLRIKSLSVESLLINTPPPTQRPSTERTYWGANKCNNSHLCDIVWHPTRQTRDSPSTTSDASSARTWPLDSARKGQEIGNYCTAGSQPCSRGIIVSGWAGDDELINGTRI